MWLPCETCGHVHGDGVRRPRAHTHGRPARALPLRGIGAVMPMAPIVELMLVVVLGVRMHSRRPAPRSSPSPLRFPHHCIWRSDVSEAPEDRIRRHHPQSASRRIVSKATRDRERGSQCRLRAGSEVSASYSPPSLPRRRSNVDQFMPSASPSSSGLVPGSSRRRLHSSGQLHVAPALQPGPLSWFAPIRRPFSACRT